MPIPHSPPLIVSPMVRTRRTRILLTTGLLFLAVGQRPTRKESGWHPAPLVPHGLEYTDPRPLLLGRHSLPDDREPGRVRRFATAPPRISPADGPLTPVIDGASKHPRRPPVSTSALSHVAALATELRKLSAVAPPAAAEHLLSLHPADRVSVVTWTLRDAASRSPDEAVNEAVRFCDEDPSYSLEYGRALIAALASTNDYRAALRFVRAQESDGWLGENGHKWLTTLLTDWAMSDPSEAAKAAQHSVGPALRGEALQIVAATWATTDAAAAAKFAAQLPSSPERDLAMRAVRQR